MTDQIPLDIAQGNFSARDSLHTRHAAELDTARNDLPKQTQVVMNIQRETMHGHTRLDPHSQRADFLVSDPDSRVLGVPVRADPIAVEGLNDGVL